MGKNRDRERARRNWNGSERLFDDPTWRERFGLVVHKPMKADMRDEFVRCMLGEGLDVAQDADEDERYAAALAFARSRSRVDGGFYRTVFASGLYAEYPESAPVWCSRVPAVVAPGRPATTVAPAAKTGTR